MGHTVSKKLPRHRISFCLSTCLEFPIIIMQSPMKNGIMDDAAALNVTTALNTFEIDPLSLVRTGFCLPFWGVVQNFQCDIFKWAADWKQFWASSPVSGFYQNLCSSLSQSGKLYFFCSPNHILFA